MSTQHGGLCVNMAATRGWRSHLTWLRRWRCYSPPSLRSPPFAVGEKRSRKADAAWSAAIGIPGIVPPQPPDAFPVRQMRISGWMPICRSRPTPLFFQVHGYLFVQKSFFSRGCLSRFSNFRSSLRRGRFFSHCSQRLCNARRVQWFGHIANLRRTSTGISIAKFARIRIGHLTGIARPVAFAGVFVTEFARPTERKRPVVTGKGRRIPVRSIIRGRIIIDREFSRAVVGQVHNRPRQRRQDSRLFVGVEFATRSVAVICMSTRIATMFSARITSSARRITSR